MTKFEATKAAVPTQADRNQDGSEVQQWVADATNADELTSLSHDGPLEKMDGSTASLTMSDLNGRARSGADSTADLDNMSTISATRSSRPQQPEDHPPRSGTGLFKDPNPRVIRREATEKPVVYQQNIFLRFLQPPPAPSPGPLIITEVRPPPPPPPPPLVIRQRAPPLPQAPPLILRERPPNPPPPVPSQTVIRSLPPLPPPPRSFIVERLAPLPAKPRDIIIERWIPYRPPAKRRTIIQRCIDAPSKYPAPRNVIIVYDNFQAHIVRKIQRLEVTPQNPDEYVSRYGPSLLDPATLVEQARAAGVVEDISPPTPYVSPRNGVESTVREKRRSEQRWNTVGS